MMTPSLRKVLVICLIPYAFCTNLSPLGGGIHNVQTEGEKGGSVKDFTNRKSGSEYLAQEKGRSTKEDSSELEKKDTESHEKKQNSGHYDEQDSVQKGHEVGRQTAGDSHKIDQGEHAVEKQVNGQEKKGYHKSGFVHKYHKDESGDNSSYYEDSNNESGHKGYEGRGGQYHEKAADSYKDGVHDKSHAGKNHVNKGVYAKGEGYNNQYNYAGGHDDSRYDDDRRKIYHDGAGRYYDHKGNEIFYYRREQPNPYYPNEYYPHGQSHYDAYYPRDQYDTRYYADQPDYHKGDTYYPEAIRHYDEAGNTWADYYRDGYSTGYQNGYLPHGARHQEYYRSY